jgi:multidrug efflux pump subunit AcrA (membrane-fusion protein)
VLALIFGTYEFYSIGKLPDISGLSTQEKQGALLPSGAVSLSFAASGRVAEVDVKLGDKVTKGETLAALDTSVAQGAVAQAKGALDLAKAQYGSMSVQYQNTWDAQDQLVQNAFSTLLSSGLAAIPTGNNDETHNPTITGTYTCAKEGTYTIAPYTSATPSGYSFNVTGLEVVNAGEVTYGTPQPLGTCGLFITFQSGFISSSEWTVSIPNINSSSYQANKNAYDLAVQTRNQTISQLAANLGRNGTTTADIASAAISAAEGNYEAAQAALANNSIVAPEDGVVSFIDGGLRVGQSVSAGVPLVTIANE